MGRVLNQASLKILEDIKQRPEITAKDLYASYKKQMAYKDFYNTLFRLTELGLIKKEQALGLNIFSATQDGEKTLMRDSPKKDGVWKLIVFDIPEKHKSVRNILRGRLKALHFKKWQNSIYVSPYALDAEVESELKQLAKKYFVRLIKTTEINDTSDLVKLFN